MQTRFLRDPVFWVALGAAFIFWAGLYFWYKPDLNFGWPLQQPMVFIKFALLYPVIEEIVFRGLVQDSLSRRTQKTFGPLSLANLVTSLLFTGTHFFYHAPVWSLVVFLPSLLFGYFRERYRSLLPPICLHGFYNAGYYLLFAGPTT